MTICVFCKKCIHRGFTVRFQADELLLFLKKPNILWLVVNLCKLHSRGNRGIEFKNYPVH